MGIPLAAGIVNFVVLTAALSSCNSGMYSTGRMLRDLAANSQAPKIFGRLNSRKSPAVGIAVSVALMGVGVVINYLVPEKAFGYVTSVATAAGIWTWMMILCSHIRYRLALKAGRLPRSSFPAPGGAVASAVALLFLVMVAVIIALDSEARVSLYVGAVWAVLLLGGWARLKGRERKAAAAVQEQSDGTRVSKYSGTPLRSELHWTVTHPRGCTPWTRHGPSGSVHGAVEPRQQSGGPPGRPGLTARSGRRRRASARVYRSPPRGTSGSDRRT
jgi:AAT family amino acid transporter